MFVARSARRIRFARLAFVAVGLVPCAAVGAWAVHRNSTAHRDAIRRDWEQAVGLPIAMGSVEHPLPGVVRVRGCRLLAADGAAVVDVPKVTVETSPTEVRLGVASLACDPAGAALLAGLAAEWLERGARFRRDVVIDVDDFAWQVPAADGRPRRYERGRVRIECVVKEGDRAVRIVRRDGEDEGGDEVRIVRSGGADRGSDRLDVEASCAEPLPFPILAAVVGRGPVAGLLLGGSALVRGGLTAARVDGAWSGTATGRVEGIDLTSCTSALVARASGTMDVRVEGMEWRGGRITAAECVCQASSGRVDRRLLETLISTLGCRAGAAYVGAVAERDAVFDALGCALRIDGRGVAVAGVPHLGGAVVTAGGRPVLDPPAGIVPVERLAWLFAAPGAVYVPSSGGGSWLMSVLPNGGTVERSAGAAAGPTDGGF